MARAGHSDFKTTQGYIDLAGEKFREEADRLERRLWGDSRTQNRYKVARDEVEAVPSPCRFGSTERRRSRTYPATGYAASPVLKTDWATGPMPLRDGG
jgi:hypothetical protein